MRSGIEVVLPFAEGFITSGLATRGGAAETRGLADEPPVPLRKEVLTEMPRA